MPSVPDTTTAENRLGRSVSLDQAAELLKVSRRTIYNRIRDGRLQTVRTIGGSQRVVLESLLALEPRTHAPNPRVPAAEQGERAGN